MSQDTKHAGSLTLSALETNLRFQEGIWKRITALKIVGAFTVATHDDQTEVPDNSLKLELDPDGTKPVPPGYTENCRGDALIGGVPKRVATFRKA